MPKADIRDSPPLAVLEINIGLDRGYTNMLDVSVMRMQRATTFSAEMLLPFPSHMVRARNID